MPPPSQMQRRQHTPWIGRKVLRTEHSSYKQWQREGWTTKMKVMHYTIGKKKTNNKMERWSKGSVPIIWYWHLFGAFQRVCTSTPHCQNMDFSPLNPILLRPKAKSNSKRDFRIDWYKGGGVLSLPSSSSPCKNTRRAELSTGNSQIFQDNSQTNATQSLPGNRELRKHSELFLTEAAK